MDAESQCKTWRHKLQWFVITAYAQKGDVEKADEWLGGLEKAAEELTVTSQRSVINACAQKGDAEKAEQ